MSAPPETVRAHVFISGKVQGVGYRYSTLQQAQQQGINGWVRNLADKRVEAVFEGNSTAVQQMIDWCHQGPRGSVVKEIIVEKEEPVGISNFEIL